MASITTSPFFLHSNEERYLVGITELPASLKDNLYSHSYAMILAYVMIIIGTLALLYGGYIFFSHPLTDTDTVNLSGWITSVKRDGEEPLATLMYRYTYGDETYYGTTTIERSQSFDYLPGEVIDLNLNINTPEQAQVGIVTPAITVPLPVFLGGLLMTAGLLLAGAVFIYRRQYLKLFHSNQIVTGEVLMVKDFHKLNNQYEIEVWACFNAPDTGKLIEGRRRYQVDMVKAALLPEVGAALRIVYLNPNVWEIL